MKKQTPVHKIRPDVEYMPPEDYELPAPKLVVTHDGPITYCPHEQIKIYPYHRIIQCSACSATLDPFEYLLAVGKQENSHLSHLRYLQIQSKQYTEEVEKLRKEVNKLKKVYAEKNTQTNEN